MEMTQIRMAAILATMLLLAVIISGCMDAGVANGSSKATMQPAKTIRKLTVSGSTTVLSIAQQAAEAFMNNDAGADIKVSGGGSSVGVKAIGEGTVDIGMSSRDLTADEKKAYPSLVQYTIGSDGISLIVHPSNSIASISLDELKGIYDGTITNWKALGGDDKVIVVIGRDSASGTRQFFQDTVMKKGNMTAKMLEMNSNGAIKQQVSQTPGAIGYVGLGYIDTTVKALALDTGSGMVMSSAENVLNGKYPISRPLYLLTRGQASGLGKEYIDFLLSPEGQKLVQEEGFVPIM